MKAGYPSERMSPEIIQYYETLGVQPGSSSDEVRAAYESCLGRFPSAWFQPKRVLEPEEGERVETLVRAYERIIGYLRNRPQLLFPWLEQA